MRIRLIFEGISINFRGCAVSWLRVTCNLQSAGYARIVEQDIDYLTALIILIFVHCDRVVFSNRFT